MIANILRFIERSKRPLHSYAKFQKGKTSCITRGLWKQSVYCMKFLFAFEHSNVTEKFYQKGDYFFWIDSDISHISIWMAMKNKKWKCEIRIEEWPVIPLEHRNCPLFFFSFYCCMNGYKVYALLSLICGLCLR